jgi:hypothetical protein
MASESVILDRLARIEAELDALCQRATVRDYYTVADFAERVGKKEFTVREWCRLGRTNGEKRQCGRGEFQEWKISHAEFLRYLNDGLLPDARRPTPQTRSPPRGTKDRRGNNFNGFGQYSVGTTR